MRAKRENTYGVPARIPANADCNDLQSAAVAADLRTDDPNRLSNALCACVRSGLLMPSGSASRLTSGRAVLDRTSRLPLPGLRTTRVPRAFSRDLAEGITALRSAAEQSLAVLP